MRSVPVIVALFVLQFQGQAAPVAAPPGLFPQQATGQLSAQDVAQVQAQAETGDPAAQQILGGMYLVGQGVERNKKTAVEWFRKSARQGNADAMCDLGAAYYNGDGVNVDDALSYAWFTLATEKGNRRAAEAVQRAASELKPLTISDSFTEIARMYEKGVDLPENQAEAARWTLKAAERGDSLAQSVIGMRLLSGSGVTQDFAAARMWCDKGAKAGDAGAEYCLGYIDQLGLGVSKNPKQVRVHYERAAVRRYRLAIKALAQMEVTGEGGKIDRVEACLLCVSLATTGDYDSLEKLAKLKHSMDANEWKKVQARLPIMHIDPVKLDVALDNVKT